MARDAIAHLAEAREVDKQPLLEQRRQRVVQIGEASETPQVLDDLRVLREPEEVRQQAEAVDDLFPSTP